jgi:hypothetical protein
VSAGIDDVPPAPHMSISSAGIVWRITSSTSASQLVGAREVPPGRVVPGPRGVRDVDGGVSRLLRKVLVPQELLDQRQVLQEAAHGEELVAHASLGLAAHRVRALGLLEQLPDRPPVALEVGGVDQ